MLYPVFSFPDLNFSFTVFLGPNLTNQLQLNEVDLKTSLNRLYKEPKICWTEIASSLNRGFLILFLVFFSLLIVQSKSRNFLDFFLMSICQHVVHFFTFWRNEGHIERSSFIAYLFYHIFDQKIRIIHDVVQIFMQV